MKRLVAITLLGLAAAGCRGIIPESGGPVPASAPAPAETIRYETGPCLGPCPVYLFTIASDGSGNFEGIGNTQVRGKRSFQASPAQYRAFAAALAPYRPSSGERRYQGAPNCATEATDLPVVQVSWSGGNTPPARLHYYFGCDMEKHQAMAAALGNAPDLLPALEPLIGPRP